MEIEWHEAPRSDLRSSFHLAEDSDEQLDSYLGLGRVLVARRGGAVVGHLQLTGAHDEGVLEIKNMAVAELERGAGVGRALIERAVAAASREGSVRLIVATGAADVGNLRFYHRCGFRMVSVERDAFTPETDYRIQS